MCIRDRVCSEPERDARVLYRGGQSSKVTTATVLELGDGVVWELTGTVARLRAEAEVSGRLEATRRRRALACSASCLCMLWHVRAGVGTSFAERCTGLLGRGLGPSCAGT